ncbi:hypothetical protein HDU98_012042 [Podochytrium sp. JEL0797]|nr:hypothetical protein HDU98_012042 [Podochytrium sp. JEL0797]
MRIVFSSTVVKGFTRCIQSLARTGEDCYIELMPPDAGNEGTMLLYSVNLARTAFVKLALLPSFFDEYATGSLQPRHFKVLLKPGHVDLIEKCILRLLEGGKDDVELHGDRLVIELHCKYGTNDPIRWSHPVLYRKSEHNSKGVRKIYQLHYQATEPLKATFSKQACTNAFSASPKIIQDWLTFFSYKLDEVSIGCVVGANEGPVSKKVVMIKSFSEGVESSGMGTQGDADVANRSLSTEISVDLDDFDSFDVFGDVEVTFSLKDLKTALGFADGIGQSIEAHFIGPGQPIIFSTSQPNIFNADFVLATNTFGSATPASSAKPTASQRVHSQPNNHVKNEATPHSSSSSQAYAFSSAPPPRRSNPITPPHTTTRTNVSSPQSAPRQQEDDYQLRGPTLNKSKPSPKPSSSRLSNAKTPQAPAPTWSQHPHFLSNNHDDDDMPLFSQSSQQQQQAPQPKQRPRLPQLPATTKRRRNDFVVEDSRSPSVESPKTMLVPPSATSPAVAATLHRAGSSSGESYIPETARIAPQQPQQYLPTSKLSATASRGGGRGALFDDSSSEEEPLKKPVRRGGAAPPPTTAAAIVGEGSTGSAGSSSFGRGSSSKEEKMAMDPEETQDPNHHAYPGSFVGAGGVGVMEEEDVEFDEEMDWDGAVQASQAAEDEEYAATEKESECGEDYVPASPGKKVGNVGESGSGVGGLVGAGSGGGTKFTIGSARGSAGIARTVGMESFMLANTGSIGVNKSGAGSSLAPPSLGTSGKPPMQPVSEYAKRFTLSQPSQSRLRVAERVDHESEQSTVGPESERYNTDSSIVLPTQYQEQMQQDQDQEPGQEEEPEFRPAMKVVKKYRSNAQRRINRVSLAPPTSSQVLLKFLASPINPADINQVQGTYPLLPKLSKNLLQHNPDEPYAIGGNEGVAEIVHVGKDVQGTSEWLKIGSRVVMRHAGFGTWRQFATAQPSDLLPMNYPGVSTTAAATIMVNPCTAYRMLSDFASLSPGDTVIQNGANSAVGQAVIQVAKWRGLKTINLIRGTLGTPGAPRPGLDALKQRLDSLGADLVVTEEEMRSRDTQARILALGAGRLPRLGLNCVGGKSSTNLARNLAEGASMVTYGGMSKEPVAIPTGLLIFKDLKFRGFWMTRWNDVCVKEGLEAEREVMLKDLCGLIKDGRLLVPEVETLSVQSEQDIESVKAAFEKAMRGGSTTKQLLEFK